MSLQPGLFDSATIPFFRTDAESDLVHQLEYLLHENDRYTNNHLVWRADMVTDPRGFAIPAGAERLIRWDTRHPDIVFDHGFEPWVTPSNQSGLDWLNADLGSYIDDNVDSIFVSTARPYWSSTGQIVSWSPCITAGRFEYEVFTHGGIDINQSFGRRNRWSEEHEIVFPGGIRPELIRTARQFDQNGQAVAIWINSYFDVPANSDIARVHLYHLPDPLCGSSIDVHYWMGPSDDRPVPSRRSYYAYELVDDRTCKDSRATTPDELGDSCLDARPARASFLSPTDPSKAYFFADTQYVSVTVAPETNDDKIISGPKIIAHEWAALRAAYFGQVDAVLPTNRGNEVYFFSRDKYALVDVTYGPEGSKLIDEPKKTATEWLSLKQAGCKTIDAVLPYPGATDKAYFFCGNQFTVVEYKVGTTENAIVQAPLNISDTWPLLARAGFDRIDSVLPNPNNSSEAYFFSGARYMLAEVRPKSTDDVAVDGPKRVNDGWPSLKSAAFYG